MKTFEKTNSKEENPNKRRIKLTKMKDKFKLETISFDS